MQDPSTRLDRTFSTQHSSEEPSAGHRFGNATEATPEGGETAGERVAATSVRTQAAIVQRDSVDTPPSHDWFNFLALAIYQVVLRTGWIFKTESVIMPAVLHSLGAPGWMRGVLPMLNRFGQSVGPMLAARRVKRMQRKKWSLVVTSFLMAVSFALLAALWWRVPDPKPFWLAAPYLVVYGAFFVATGANQLCLGTLTGKLVRADRRGRLMLLANVVGSASAVTAAYCLLPQWLEAEGAAFGAIFAVTAALFGLASASAALAREQPDAPSASSAPPKPRVREAWETLTGDRNFRRLVMVAVLFDISVTLFPHYQALACGSRVNLDMTHLVWWVVVQNIGLAVFSLLAGPIADRWGNRAALRVLMLGVCGAPLSAVIVSRLGAGASHWYTGVFVLVGMTPVVVRTLQNYTLEIAPETEHTRYLSALSLCLVLPIMASPLIGALIDSVGFDPVFLGIAALVLAAWLMTFRLAEPRHAGKHDAMA